MNYNEYMEQIGMSMTDFDLASNWWSLVCGVVAYVFMAIGMYAIAKRRGIRNPWLAWIPFGSTWLLGCISDQYRYVTMGQEKSKRKVMLGLEISVAAVGTAAISILFISMIKLFSLMDGEQIMEESGYMVQVLGPMLAAVVLCFVMLGLAIALTVLTYMAVYDLFKSCSPGTATMNLVLSIVLSLFGIGGVLQGIFVFANRKLDLGMPPRRDQVQYIQPTWQNTEQPVWQPPQPPVEPWEQNNEHF